MKRLTFIIVACMLGWGGIPTLATAPQIEIVIENSSPYYLPASANAPVGASVRWDNPTPSPHTITHDGCLDEGPCMFDSGAISPGASYSIPSLPPGQYPYACRLHPIMRGVLTVVDPPGPATQT